MRTICHIIIFLLASCSFINCATAGPFGLSKGMTIDQIDKAAKAARPGFYLTNKVPRSDHLSFKQYTLIIGPSRGLCAIMATSKDIETNSSGTKLRREFEKIRNILENKYEEGKTIDYLNSKSIWYKPDDFMMGLAKKERIFSAVWQDFNDSVREEDLEAITLRALAYSSRSDLGYLMLDFRFTGFESCMNEIGY